MLSALISIYVDILDAHLFYNFSDNNYYHVSYYQANYYYDNYYYRYHRKYFVNLINYIQHSLKFL